MAKTGRINFGGGGGIDPDELNALPEHVLTGKSFGGSGSDEPQTGNMPNRGAVTQALNAGGSYTIPNGYHNGSGKITANSLASQTSATATAGYIYNGKTAWVNGSKITGNMTVGSILNFSAAAYSTTQILLKWQNPYAATGKPFSGVFINYSTGGYPGMWGGTRIYTGAGNNTASGGWSQVIVNMPAAGTGYYFSCNTYCTCSAGDFYGNTLNAYAVTVAHGQYNFTQSQSWALPTGVYSIDIFCVGGGGGGGSGQDAMVGNGGGGGGGGYTSTVKNIAVTPGQVANITVGGGGSGSNLGHGNAGGMSSFAIGGAIVVSANGGKGGLYKSGGGNGGSGGGGAGYGNPTSANQESAGSGGTNGSDGSYAWEYPGTGQHTTTRAFAEESNALYAGGGGGGMRGPSGNGAGGAGGGGKGATAWDSNSHGTANTGGGGGGGYNYSPSSGGAGNGGSGIVIVRW